MVREFIAFGQKLGRNQKGSALRQLPSLRPCAGARVALQRCPILRTSAFSLPYSYLPFRKGDISTLQKRGHFYFALTEILSAFLLTIP